MKNQTRTHQAISTMYSNKSINLLAQCNQSRKKANPKKRGGWIEENKPRREIIDKGNQHLELAATFRSKTRVHLNVHGISNLSQLRNWGPTLLLKLPHHGHRATPLPGAPHEVAHHQRRRRTRRGGAHDCYSHRHLAHDTKSVGVTWTEPNLIGDKTTSFSLLANSRDSFSLVRYVRSEHSYIYTCSLLFIFTYYFFQFNNL